MKKIITTVLIVFTFISIEAQIESASLSFTRGKLWQSVYNGKIAPSFNNWRRVGVGLDWPGFDPSWVNQQLGGAPSYMLSGGFIVGAKKTNDSVLVVEDWSLSAGTISTEASAKYIITKHHKPYGETGNFWLQRNPASGEEVIETVWEFNKDYNEPFGILQQMPIRVKRTSHQWSGNKREENYIIHEYVFTNISSEVKNYFAGINDSSRVKVIPDTLKDFVALVNYAIHANSRSWNVLFPTETPGARNTTFLLDPANNMIMGRADDYKKTKVIEPGFGFAYSQGLTLDKGPGGEYLAPGYVGVKVLKASMNFASTSNEVKKTQGTRSLGLSAGDNSFDFSGPLANKNTEFAQYDVVIDPSKANNYVTSRDSTFLQQSRMWSMISLGPWTLAPNDSLLIVIVEAVDGVDYALAVDSSESVKLRIGPEGGKIFASTMNKATATFRNGYNHPDPPAAPSFDVNFYKERQRFVATEITFGNNTESLQDPDDAIADLAGYKIYRSAHLPIGPWVLADSIVKGSPAHFNASTGKYTVIDSAVQIGTSYYYAVTAFDTGRASWNINPTARFEETGNTVRVPSMESSIFANRKIQRFTATLPASENTNDVVVVPNPFVLGEGRIAPGEADRIQFINIPNPCTIRIYTIRGDKVKTIDINENSGAIASWDQVTDFGQFVESGVYIYNIESPSGNKTGKFSIIR